MINLNCEKHEILDLRTINDEIMELEMEIKSQENRSDYDALRKTL